MIGASITITDEDSSETILATTWNGSTITTEIATNTNYTVSVEVISGYLACADQTYQAGYQTTKNITFQYRALGAFIEATDGTLYTSSEWSNNITGKTANSIVVITSVCSRRWALIDFALKEATTDSTKETQYGSYMTGTTNESTAKADYNGRVNTERALLVESSTSFAAGYCNAYTFPNGVTNGHWPSLGEYYQMCLNITAFNSCRTALGLSAYGDGSNDYVFASTYYGLASGLGTFWALRSNGTCSQRYARWGYAILPAAEYE